MPSGFDNGFVFKAGNIIANEGKDEQGNSVQQYKTLANTYNKGDMQVDLYISNRPSSVGDVPVAAVVGQTNLYYTTFTHKFVDLSYVKTPQELTDEAAGKLGFGMTNMQGKEPYTQQVQIVTFTIDGMEYELHCADTDLTEQALIDMATEILAQ